MKVCYRVYKSTFGNQWVVEYYCDGRCDTDVRGTAGTGVKIFSTKEKAEASGRRYVKSMVVRGFEEYKHR